MPTFCLIPCREPPFSRSGARVPEPEGHALQHLGGADCHLPRILGEKTPPCRAPCLRMVQGAPLGEQSRTRASLPLPAGGLEGGTAPPPPDPAPVGLWPLLAHRPGEHTR